MKTSEAIRARRSIRKFVPGADITQAQVEAILEAAMLAPSACNTRPWIFVVVRDRTVLDRIAEVHPYAGMLKTAALAIVMYALPEVQNKDIDRGYYPQDCGAATQNILLEAAAMGLGTCWCGVYPKEDRIAEINKILETEGTPFNVIALGVPDEQPQARGHFEPGKVRYI